MLSSRPILLLLLLPLLLPPPTLAHQHCTRTSHCQPSHPSHTPLCVRRHSLCLSLPSRTLRQSALPPFDSLPDTSPAPPTPEPELVFRPLAELVAETDADPIPLPEKHRILKTISRVYTAFNPHVFLHRNLLNLDFPAAISSLASSLTPSLSNTAFYQALIRTFQLMDDRHSLFILPAPFNSSIAALPFEVSIFHDAPASPRRYVVTQFIADALSEPLPAGSTFDSGSELLTYDGQPIDLAVLQLGRDSAASNLAAQIDSGLQLLTLRLLAVEPIPVEKSVVMEYRNPNGERDSVSIDWLFAEIAQQPLADAMVARSSSRADAPFLFGSSSLGRDPFHIPHGDTPSDKADSSTIGPKLLKTVRIAKDDRTEIPVDPAFQMRFKAEIIPTSQGPIGRLTVGDFASMATPEIIRELSRVLSLMPKNGLIMDLRGNTGGQGDYVKVLIELISGVSAPPSPSVVRATKFANESFATVSKVGLKEEELSMLSIYRSAISSAFRIGEPFSGPTVGIYSDKVMQKVEPRVYFGPIVTLVNGLSYSAGDLFALLQIDLDISPVVGVSDNVGAGGASTMAYSMLKKTFNETLDDVDVEFTTSFGRYYRSGKKRGTIVENFGLKPTIRYYPTLNDALKDDCDLYEFLAGVLSDLRDSEPLASPEEEEFVSPTPEEIV